MQLSLTTKKVQMQVYETYLIKKITCNTTKLYIIRRNLRISSELLQQYTYFKKIHVSPVFIMHMLHYICILDLNHRTRGNNMTTWGLYHRTENRVGQRGPWLAISGGVLVTSRGSEPTSRRHYKDLYKTEKNARKSVKLAKKFLMQRWERKKKEKENFLIRK